MASRRENDFPVTSIGRSAGARLQQPAAAAHEAHPLLSPGPSSPTPSESGHSGTNSGSGATLSVNGAPRYVPYTPRQRVTPTAATTGTTVHPSSPQQHQGDATSKLQIMHLKAAAQSIGLDSGTLGWAILEKLVLDLETSDEWIEVWHAITTGKATLLLPLESTTSVKITADFLKDHVVLCEGPSRKNAPIITLSGLRGTLDGETLTFRSSLNPTSKLFHELLNHSTRASAFSSLPPLPESLPDVTPTASFPQFDVPQYSSSLHLPPRTPLAKPPLPPRPGGRPIPTTNSSVGRITNPFASLFGAKTATPVPASPPSSLHSIESTTDTNASIEISAFTIGRKIVRKDVAKEVNRALKSELKAALASTASLGNTPVPSWVADRVHEITTEWYPFIKVSSGSLKRLGASDKDSIGNGHGYIVNPIEENPDDAAEHLQDFYLALEQDMRLGGTPFILRRKDKDRDGEADVDDEKEKEKRQNERMESETRVREVMEAVERTITSLFYDRLFKQPTTDDASHDEALSSRVAALNMLDLGLGHLGIEVGEAVNEAELDAVVKACGDMLTQLDTCRSPGDKSAILVAAHKIVVDGLSRLPPIRLISEKDIDEDANEEPPTAKPTTTEFSHSDDKPSGIPSPDNLQSTPNASSSSSTSASPNPVNSPPSKVKSPPPPLSLDTPSQSGTAPHLELPSIPKDPTPVSGDVLLPLIIFSVVKANPPHLVSNLLYTQRFRNQSVGGEESYCLINLMAVAEFLENVDMAGLGLGDSDKVMSTADLTPIPLTRSPLISETPLEPLDGGQGLRGRVGLQVDAIADSANKVISGVVDSSFGILRSFMPAGVDPKSPASLSGRLTPGTPGGRPGFGLLRRESGFSIASLAASLPIAGRSRSNTNTGEESGQQLITVSRPSSIRSRASLRVKLRGGDESQDEVSDDDSESVASNEEDESEAGEEEVDAEGEEDAGGQSMGTGDARSIRSFESMLSASKEKSKMSRARKSLSDRLASVSALAGRKGHSPPPDSRRSSLLHPQPTTARPSSPTSSRAVSPSPTLRLAPPKQRFIECTPDDLRLSEIGELLREYRRLVEGIRSVGGFDE